VKREVVSMQRRAAAVIALVFVCAACHPGPVINTGAKQPSVGGTIAGIVSATGGTMALSARKVTATNIETGARFEASTGTNGGYTIKVPEGRYRLDVEVRPGETIAERPGETRINNGDLDPHRNFVLTLKPGGDQARRPAAGSRR
jgi:hypothetical protein